MSNEHNFFLAGLREAACRSCGVGQSQHDQLGNCPNTKAYKGPAESVSPAPQLKSGQMRGFVTYEHPEPVAAPQEVTRYGFVWNERKTHCQLFEHPDGGYVFYSAYAAKCAELQKAESRLAEVRKALADAIVELSYVQEAPEAFGIVASAKGAEIVDSGMKLLGLKGLHEDEIAKMLAGVKSEA